MFPIDLPQFGAIGIDVGHDGIKLLQLRAAGDGNNAGASLAVAGAARRLFHPSPGAGPAARLAEVPRLLREILSRGEFRGRRAVASLPSDLVEIRTVRVPAPAAGSLREAACAKAAESLSFPLDAASAEVLPAGRVD